MNELKKYVLNHNGGPLDGVAQEFESTWAPTSAVYQGENQQALGWYSRDELLPIRDNIIEMFWHDAD